MKFLVCKLHNGTKKAFTSSTFVKPVAQRDVLKFSAHPQIGVSPIVDRLMPGTLTDQIQKIFKEPRLLWCVLREHAGDCGGQHGLVVEICGHCHPVKQQRPSRSRWALKCVRCASVGDCTASAPRRTQLNCPPSVAIRLPSSDTTPTNRRKQQKQQQQLGPHMQMFDTGTENVTNCGTVDPWDALFFRELHPYQSW
ncbi:hypothetical protein niasHS_015463 [Heterodera schachtii]|uniref:Uncharacterized protein n=1 Tax=Heterodera schachtii TaxID=97005 RepID=A0ABD2HPY8_HETSC